MQTRSFGAMDDVPALTLGGGGLGQVWGKTDRAEAVATVVEALSSGITLFDLAPMYGRGEAESVVGEAFAGILPAGVRVTTKCFLGNPAGADVEPKIRRRLGRSLDLLKLTKVDLLILHSNVVPDAYIAADPEVRGVRMTAWSTYVNYVIPTFEKLQQEGLIGAWGITGIGLPETVKRAVAYEHKPALIQAIANCLDSPGDLQFFQEDPEPRALIAAAAAAGVGVMGIRAVQAGALSDGFDRQMQPGKDVADFERAAGFRELALQWQTTPAALAHRYALSMQDIATVVLGVKNRTELRECLAMEALPRLTANEMTKVREACGLPGLN